MCARACICVSAWAYATRGQVPVKAIKGCWNPWSWNRRLRVAQPDCWELNWAVLDLPPVFSVAEPSFQPYKMLLIYLLERWHAGHNVEKLTDLVIASEDTNGFSLLQKQLHPYLTVRQSHSLVFTSISVSVYPHQLVCRSYIYTCLTLEVWCCRQVNGPIHEGTSIG